VSYNELTRRYFHDPACIGTLEGPDCYRGAAGSRSAGTWVQFDIRLGRAGAEPRVREARFLAFGCPHVIAAASLVAEQAEGATPESRLPQSVHALRERLEAPVEKLGRLFVVEDAWIAALQAAHSHITQSSC
jgi:NifU-like protein involved in Fe-S cluster formation